MLHITGHILPRLLLFIADRGDIEQIYGGAFCAPFFVALGRIYKYSTGTQNVIIYLQNLIN